HFAVATVDKVTRQDVSGTFTGESSGRPAGLQTTGAPCLQDSPTTRLAPIFDADSVLYVEVFLSIDCSNRFWTPFYGGAVMPGILHVVKALFPHCIALILSDETAAFRRPPNPQLSRRNSLTGTEHGASGEHGA